jgi:hypothetical protein
MPSMYEANVTVVICVAKSNIRAHSNWTQVWTPQCRELFNEGAEHSQLGDIHSQALQCRNKAPFILQGTLLWAYPLPVQLSLFELDNPELT